MGVSFSRGGYGGLFRGGLVRNNEGFVDVMV